MPRKNEFFQRIQSVIWEFWEQYFQYGKLEIYASKIIINNWSNKFSINYFDRFRKKIDLF